MQLNILTVWHNESSNLPKYFKSLRNFSDLCDTRIIYCDQGSLDNSLEIAKKYNAEIYEHGKKWYCEWSRKRCVDNLFKDWDWILVLDCDEEITLALAKEIVNTIENQDIWVIKIPKDTIAFGMPVGIEYAIRLFKKWSIEVTDTIHEYIKITNEPYIVLNNNLENSDLKEKSWKEIFNWIDKANKYTETDYWKYKNMTKYRLVFNLFFKPIESFLYFYIIKWLVRYWIKWLIYAIMQSIYQFIKYSKSILSIQ